MAIFEMKSDELIELPKTTFGNEGVKERADLQRLLREQIEVVCPDTLVIAEEFGNWQDSKRRIDLLGLDNEANLVVIELKRTEDGGHMELQALRYAAMVSTMTFQNVVDARTEFQNQRGIDGDAEESVLSFLGWEEPDEDRFAQSVRIVLVSADFSKELTTAVLWLNMTDLDIRCVRLKPYTLEDDRLLLDVQQVIPLPEAAEYQVQLKEKTQKVRQARKSSNDHTRFDLSIGGETYHALPKRRAIFLVVKALVDDSIPPNRIADLIPWRSHYSMWVSVADSVDSKAFVERASKDAQAKGKTFKKVLWFCDDERLLSYEDCTYAFTNQWGKRWHEAMQILADTSREHEIVFAAVEPND